MKLRQGEKGDEENTQQMKNGLKLIVKLKKREKRVLIQFEKELRRNSCWALLNSMKLAETTVFLNDLVKCLFEKLESALHDKYIENTCIGKDFI